MQPRIWLVAACVLLSQASSAAGQTEATPDPAAVVQYQDARFTVLTPSLIRMEWSATREFEDHASLVFVNRRLPVPQFRRQVVQTEAGAKLLIETDALKIEYSPRGGDGRFNAGNLRVERLRGPGAFVWHPGMIDEGNLVGTTRTLDGAKGDKTSEPLEEGLVSRSGWVVVDDTSRPLFDGDDFRFALGDRSPWPWVIPRTTAPHQDLYLFGYGHDYRSALADYVRVAGRIPIPPRFAFGIWWSRYWAYSDQELRELVDQFHENDTPLDVLVIDMDWHKGVVRNGWDKGRKDAAGERLGWTGYTWDPALFPDPRDFLDEMHSKGIRTTLNLHPAGGVQAWEEAYPKMADAMGIDPATGKYVPFDITNKSFAANYLNLLHHPLEQEGIDFWWLDWQQHGDTPIAGLNPIWWLNYVHFTDQEREGKRPLIFHRWGGLGNHRYQVGFSGDTVSVWESLAFQPWFTATAANVGYAYWSHDIGGHMMGEVSPELYLRWLQFGAFSPILRTHTTKNPEAERRIWAYPEPYSELMRETMQLREALVPYLYTEARRTYDTGLAFLHPLYYDWPEESGAYSARGEYKFGDDLMVSPVVKAVDASGLVSQTIWIPPGEWVEWATGNVLQGPSTLARKFSLGQTPVYVRTGAIVPMAPAEVRAGTNSPRELVLNVFPLRAGQRGSYKLYEDSGADESYRGRSFANTSISSSEVEGTLTITIGPVEGSYEGMVARRGYEIRLPADWPPQSVSLTCGGRVHSAAPYGKRTWRYEGNTLTTIISVPPCGVHLAAVIRVRRERSAAEDREPLLGFAGAMTRLRTAYDLLNSTWPIGWSPDDLIELMQTGERISYRPASAAREIARFQTLLPRVQRELERMSSTAAMSELEANVKSSQGKTWTAEFIADHMKNYSDKLLAAGAQLKSLLNPPR